MLREDVGHVGLECLKDGITFSWLRGDDGDDVDHASSLSLHEKAPTILPDEMPEFVGARSSSVELSACQLADGRLSDGEQWSLNITGNIPASTEEIRLAPSETSAGGTRSATHLSDHMAKFLNTSATNFYLEELIKGAKDRLILISPFLRINDRIKELLEDKNRLKIDVRVVYGKNELHPEEINWLKDLAFIRTSFCKNLHAKCYLNEELCIITSLNLYDFSQVNNNEMGVLVSRADDPELYRSAYEEAQRIIRISDEVRMTLEKVVKEPEAKAEAEEAPGKLSSSRLAQKLGLKTAELLQRLEAGGFLEEREGKPHLTQKGKDLGGEFRMSPRFGPYFIWPASLEIPQTEAQRA